MRLIAVTKLNRWFHDVLTNRGHSLVQINGCIRIVLKSGEHDCCRSQGRTPYQALLTDAGYDFQDLSDDELAKLHVRHMIGSCRRA